MTPQESDLPPDLSAPARRAFDEAGYVRLEQFTRVSEAELKRLHGIGLKTIKQLFHALETRGLSFADKKSGKERA